MHAGWDAGEVREVAGRFSEMLKRLLPAVVPHTAPRVRASLAALAARLLLRCPRSLAGASDSLLDTLATLSADRTASVAGAAREAIAELGRREGGWAGMDRVREEVVRRAKKLPGTFR